MSNLPDNFNRQLPGLTQAEVESLPTDNIDVFIDKPNSVLSNILSPILKHHTDTAGIAPDTPLFNDLLNLKKYADTFGKVILDNSLKSNLAIGLFGNWGSGKSQFMHQIRSYIENHEQSGTPYYWNKVCHIDFNAWHYMDVNLWASIAGRIIDKLAEDLGSNENPEESRIKIRSRLRSSIEAKNKAIQRKEYAQNAFDEHTKSLDKKEALAQKFILDNKQDLIKPILNAIHKSGTSINPEEAFKSLKDFVLCTDKDDTCNDTIANIKEIQNILRELKSKRGKYKAALSSLTKLTPRKIIIALTALTALSIMPSLLSKLQNAIQPIITFTIEVILTVISAVFLFLSKIVKASKLTTFLTDVENEHSNILSKSIAKLDSSKTEEYNNLKTEIYKTQEELDRLDEQISLTRNRLKEIEEGKLVYEFALDRSSDDGVYKKNQGIVSLVRRDLELFTSLIKDWGEDSISYEKSISNLTEKKLENLKSSTNLKDLPIQKIVLYIDDLDRCPRHRVVEVLEAVSLLLTFDLFVVIIGVDPRWLERSLEQEFKGMIGSFQSNTNNYYHPAASPNDYIEKIFQIPFTLPTIDETGFSNITKHQFMIKDDSTKKNKEEAVEADKEEADVEGKEELYKEDKEDKDEPDEEKKEEPDEVDKEEPGKKDKSSNIEEQKFHLEKNER